MQDIALISLPKAISKFMQKVGIIELVKVIKAL